jgi:hypothetical protein
MQAIITITLIESQILDMYTQLLTDAIPAFQLANQNRGSQKTNVDKEMGLEPSARCHGPRCATTSGWCQVRLRLPSLSLSLQHSSLFPEKTPQLCSDA